MSKTAAWIGIALALLAFVGVFLGFVLTSPALIALGGLVLVGLWIVVSRLRRRADS